MGQPREAELPLSLQVQRQREEAARCFFPLVSLTLLLAVLIAIACPFAIVKGTLYYGTTIIVLFYAYYIMYSFNRMGHTFVRQVGTVCCSLLTDNDILTLFLFTDHRFLSGQRS